MCALSPHPQSGIVRAAEHSRFRKSRSDLSRHHVYITYAIVDWVESSQEAASCVTLGRLAIGLLEQPQAFGLIGKRLTGCRSIAQSFFAGRMRADVERRRLRQRFHRRVEAPLTRGARPIAAHFEIQPGSDLRSATRRFVRAQEGLEYIAPSFFRCASRYVSCSANVADLSFFLL